MGRDQISQDEREGEKSKLTLRHGHGLKDFLCDDQCDDSYTYTLAVSITWAGLSLKVRTLNQATKATVARKII